MRLLSQLVAISLMNLKNIPARLGPSMVIVVGIGGVVTVLIAMMAMAEGFKATMQGPGHDDRVIILRSGSNSEINGTITFDQANIISTKPGILKIDSDPMIAGESYVSVNLQKRANNKPSYVSFRGIGERSFKVRPEVSIVSGRNVEFGKFEVIVGEGVAKQFQGLELGNTVNLRNAEWKVVGIFDADDSIFESEIWADAHVLNSVFGRGSVYSSMAAQLSSTEEFEQLKNALEADPRLNIKIQREAEFYAAQSEATNQMIKGVGFTVISIMAVGAIFSVINTMYSAVSTRSKEIATLLSLGFGRVPIIFSVIIESVVLVLIGGIAAGLLAYFFFNGFTASTIGANTQVSFEFMVTPNLIATGILIATMLGIVGGLFPSIRASRLQLTAALRGD